MKTTEIEITHIDGRVLDYVVVEHEDGSTSTMLKSIYDELKANEAKTK